MRILVVEDDARLAGVLVRGLSAEGLAVDSASCNTEAAEFAELYPYDLIVLDLTLPDGSGTGLLRRLRRGGTRAPVLVLSERSGIEYKIENFEAGADDYLTKPFALAELVIRIRALLRRSPGITETVLRAADLELDRLGRRVRRGGRAIDLSPKEYSLLEHLMLNAGRVMSRTMIIESVWDQSFEGLTNIVDVYVRQLRRKVDEGYEPKLIRTARGFGYSIDAEPDARFGTR
jgi:two-component system copper resistance phosphate regulon response regulator CusR